jgi:hypothetical protein
MKPRQRQVLVAGTSGKRVSDLMLVQEKQGGVVRMACGSEGRM